MSTNLIAMETAKVVMLWKTKLMCSQIGMAKNKNKRKKSITTKNTQREVKTFGVKDSKHHNEDNVTEFVNNVDNLLESDEIPYEEKQKIIKLSKESALREKIKKIDQETKLTRRSS